NCAKEIYFHIMKSAFTKATKFCIWFLFVLYPTSLYAQEVLGSPLYEYHRNLETANYFERNNLNIYSLSFSSWYEKDSNSQHPWKNVLVDFQDKSATISSYISLLPIHFNLSYNSKYSRGFNDGASWQGKGLNSNWSLGFQYKIGGLSVVFAPFLWYSQNLFFHLVPSVHESPYAAYIPNIDLPQRFGDSPLLQFDWGETEIRYDVGSFTIGISNQNLWIGPTFFNALILSNNSGGFPRIDLGIRKTDTIFGDVEALFLLGFLEGSSYADSSIKTKNRIISGYSFSYAPVWIPGFTLGFHRTAIFYSDIWETGDWLHSFLPMGSYMGEDQLDQRASITVNWSFPQIGFKVYAEWARNDFNNSIRTLIREIQHSQAYTIGLQHAILKTNKYTVLYKFEITETMHTIDYQTEVVLGRGTAGFYTHHIVQHGYTNKGQLLGAAIDPGADSQYFGVAWYASFGSLEGYILRRSLNKDYIYGQPDSIRYHSVGSMGTEISLGFDANFILNPKLIISAGLSNSWMIAWNYTGLNDVFNIQTFVAVRSKI
ncbi:MAG: capsule assembly Wzi family protein, partial [Bacteroidales bacterium]